MHTVWEYDLVRCACASAAQGCTAPIQTTSESGTSGVTLRFLLLTTLLEVPTLFRPYQMESDYSAGRLGALYDAAHAALDANLGDPAVAARYALR